MRDSLKAILLVAAVAAFVPAYAEIPAFPSAEGFGANTIGGRGGQIVEVTNLNDAGTGSLRDALATRTGPRIVVFKVSGTITGTQNIVIREANSFVTVAGQTSPGGIQLKGHGMIVMDGGHDVVVRYLRIRPGTHLPLLEDTNGFVAWGTGSKPVYNIIVDHCSFAWSDDQNGPDALTWVTGFTSQWNIIAEGTTQGNAKGPHSTGMIVGYRYDHELNMSVHHCLIASNGSRNPLIQGSDVVDFRNNIIYNWGYNNAASWGGGWGFGAGDGITQESAFGNIVNNHYIPGPNSSTGYLFWLGNGGPTRVDGTSAERGGTRVYTAGNWGPKCPTGCSDDWQNGFYSVDYYSSGIDPSNFPPAEKSQFRSTTPFAVPPVTTDQTSTLKTRILPSVGASRPIRDIVDTRIVTDVVSLTGNINNVGAGGPWPDLATGAPNPSADMDHDGMPDLWETAHGFNPNSASDGPQDKDGDGYTNVEEYLSELAGDPVSTGISPDLNIPGFKPNFAVRRSAGEISFSFATQGVFEIGVFDLAGRRVWFQTGSASGPQNVKWSTKGQKSLLLGVYLVRLKTKEGIQQQAKLLGSKGML